ncbi:MAG: hypothetical protein HY700_05715, partial [Gemmatimonadetes bacterium]|nr:hypothetical protein [Gemmatimonadota bacterium]
ARAAQLALRRRSWRWAAGLAAILVLGVAIGRLTAPATGPRVVTVERSTTARAATYQAVAGQHFDRVETLLTMFQAEARLGRPDAQVSNVARSLLTTNRLLLDSPAATDAQMRQLLEDLELVLAQIAQLSAERGMDPTALIVQALEDNGVLLRLRSAVPAGPRAGTQGAL